MKVGIQILASFLLSKIVLTSSTTAPTKRIRDQKGIKKAII